MAGPVMTVAIPIHNGWAALPGVIESIVTTRCRPDPLEIVVVDDASDERAPREALRAVLDRISKHQVNVRVVESAERLGVARARNLACTRATGEILVVTDAHVAFVPGWDEVVERSVAPMTVLAGAIRDPTSHFIGYGCDLVVPFMGTHWVRQRPEPGTPIHVASSAATVLLRETFDRVGGYDEGMVIYGAAEPEFSLRAWLSGAQVVACPDHVVIHTFKTEPERNVFLRANRPFLLHNNLRFGLLYLDEVAALEMVRHLCSEFPKHASRALAMIHRSDVWDRRRDLADRLEHDFAWFVERFRLTNQVGMPLYTEVAQSA
jgi:GT2 family glycosyltransferase